MSTAQHSPGPWHSRRGNRGSIEIFDQSGRLIVGNALVMNEEANVRVMVSAPELVGRAQAAIAAWDSFMRSFPHTPGISPQAEDLEFREMQQLRAAIAKATGEAS